MRIPFEEYLSDASYNYYVYSLRILLRVQAR